MKRILIATPTYEGKEYVLDYWAKRIKEIISKTQFETEFLIVDNSRSDRYSKLLREYGFKVIKIKREEENLHSLANARKKLREEFLKGEYDYMLSIEQDIIPPKDIIEKLLKLRDKIDGNEVVLGVPYLLDFVTEQKGKRHENVDRMTIVSRGTFYHEPFDTRIQDMILLSELPKEEIYGCYAVGYGCILLDRAVIEKIPVRFVEGGKKPDDSYFYVDCKEKDIKVYSANLLIDEMKHFKGSTYEDTSW